MSLSDCIHANMFQVYIIWNSMCFWLYVLYVVFVSVPLLACRRQHGSLIATVHMHMYIKTDFHHSCAADPDGVNQQRLINWSSITRVLIANIWSDKHVRRKFWPQSSGELSINDLKCVTVIFLLCFVPKTPTLTVTHIPEWLMLYYNINNLLIIIIINIH